MKHFSFIVMLLGISFCSFAQNKELIKKYYTKTKDAQTVILYVKDMNTENAIHTEPIATTAARFNSISGITNFVRAGNGFFKMIIRKDLVKKILMQNFQFDEKELATTALVSENKFK